MTTLREAAQQALETLEVWDNYGGWLRASELKQAKRNTTESLAALRAALAQPASEPMTPERKACPTHCCPVHGCKYGHADCPVVLGTVPPVYPNNNGCWDCREDAALVQRPAPPQRKPLTEKE